MPAEMITLDLDRIIFRHVLKLHRFRISVNAVKILGVRRSKLSQNQSLCFGNLHWYILPVTINRLILPRSARRRRRRGGKPPSQYFLRYFGGAANLL
jgi:hypothetical protein